MVLSVSRRTDIPNYYAEWWLNRLKEGYVLVRNPRNPRQVSRLVLPREAIDCMVFWTKNPANMMQRLEQLRDYCFYFQFTLTGYGPEIEPGLPDKESLIAVFQELSKRIGRQRVIWRYDPIFLSGKYSMQFHKQAFAAMSRKLCGFTERVVISFLDLYRKIEQTTRELGLRVPCREEMLELAGELAELASAADMKIQACAEALNLTDVGIEAGSCIDRDLIERLTGREMKKGRAAGQREACGCMESIDVGAYDTCLCGCRYCYAARGTRMATGRQYDPKAPMLFGQVLPGDRVTTRECGSWSTGQLRLW